MTKTQTKDYNYTACGLDNVVIEGMPVRCDDDGQDVVQIPNVNLLHGVIACAIALKPFGITAQELKFARTDMGLTQAQLAERIKKDAQTIGRWERDEHPIDATAEMLVRIAILESLKERGLFEYIDEPKISLEMLSANCVPSADNAPIRISANDGKGYSLAA